MLTCRKQPTYKGAFLQAITHLHVHTHAGTGYQHITTHLHGYTLTSRHTHTFVPLSNGQTYNTYIHTTAHLHGYTPTGKPTHNICTQRHGHQSANTRPSTQTYIKQPQHPTTRHEKDMHTDVHRLPQRSMDTWSFGGRHSQG